MVGTQGLNAEQGSALLGPGGVDLEEGLHEGRMGSGAHEGSLARLEISELFLRELENRSEPCGLL